MVDFVSYAYKLCVLFVEFCNAGIVSFGHLKLFIDFCCLYDDSIYVIDCKREKNYQNKPNVQNASKIFANFNKEGPVHALMRESKFSVCLKSSHTRNVKLPN